MIWLLRHAQAEDGSPDAERRLSAIGERQARAVGAALAVLGVELDACLTSPRARARDTARLADEPRRVARTRPGARQAGVELDAQHGERGSDRARLALADRAQAPLGVRRAVLGLGVAQQPDHPRQKISAAASSACDNRVQELMESSTTPAGTAPPSPPSLDSPALYANRELSWLDFNERVLELAEDKRTPLMERVKFLAIYTSNLDEFTMIRLAGLHDQVDAGIDARKADGLSPSATIDRIVERVRALGARHSRQWEEHVRPALAEHGIRIVDPGDCTPAELRTLDTIFEEQVFPVLTPLAVGPGRPFPYISNLSLSLGVWLSDPVGGEELFARVKVPKEVLPRLIEIGDGVFVPLEAVIARHLGSLFPGMEVRSHAAFRVVRDADFTVSDEADDLVRAVETELRRRRFGEVVQLEVDAAMDADMRAFLIEQTEIDERQAIDSVGMLDLADLMQIHKLDGRQ